MDMLGRLLSEEMKKTLGVAMPVVNMMGANSVVAMNHVYQQPKDGYSLFGISSALCTFPATGLSKLSYKEFGMIGILFGSLPTFTVPYDSPIKSGKELIDGIKKGGLTGSNSGIGGIWHVPQMIVVDTVKGSVKYVPYNGGAPAAMAAAKKEVDFGTHDLSEALTLIKSKMLRPLIVFSEEPFVMDDGTKIPPITDFVPEMKGKVAAGMGWRALGYPKGIPQDRVDKLIDAFKTAVAQQCGEGVRQEEPAAHHRHDGRGGRQDRSRSARGPRAGSSTTSSRRRATPRTWASRDPNPVRSEES